MLTREHWVRVPELTAGERSGLFAMGDALYGCYLRVGDPGPWAGPWAGIAGVCSGITSWWFTVDLSRDPHVGASLEHDGISGRIRAAPLLSARGRRTVWRRRERVRAGDVGRDSRLPPTRGTAGKASTTVVAGLNLLAAIIIYWNTLKLGDRRLREAASRGPPPANDPNWFNRSVITGRDRWSSRAQCWSAATTAKPPSGSSAPVVTPATAPPTAAAATEHKSVRTKPSSLATRACGSLRALKPPVVR